ncbi:MAG TPA: flagellar motor switch protein FliM, partial [Desulfobacteria bacterium]|nr:flagellar motor switch protein FliM [Desulfobacteria bacterium]
NKFSKEQIHTLQAIHDNYARLLASYLSARLRTPVQMSVHSVEQLTYEEFIQSLPNLTIINIFRMDPLEGNAVLEINSVIGFTIIDRLFGGTGQAPEKIRELTDIEKAVIEPEVVRTLQILKEAWENVIEFRPKLDVIEMNPLFTQIVSPSEMVVLVCFRTQVGEVEGLINLCIPFIVLEPIISKLSAHFLFAGTAKEITSENIQKIKNRLEKASINLSAVLGTASIKVEELLELQVGDVVMLESKVNQPVEIVVNSKKKFLARPGTSGSRTAVQIVSVVKEGDGENE